MTAPATAPPSAADTSLAAQAAIAEQAASLLRNAWPQLNPQALRDTLPQFKLAVAAIAHRYGQAAASAALQFYLDRRVAAGIPGRPSLRVAPLPSLDKVGATVDWATGPLWGNPDVEAAERQLDAAVQKLVLDVGRDTITGAVRQDRAAKGWARVPESGACSFCALLATRGAVYKQDTVTFRSHDHCRCHAEPVFNAYEPSAQIREWQAIYRALPHGTPKQLRLGFRRALEGR